VRFLLDENMPEGTEVVFAGLGHEALHVKLSDLRGSTDIQPAAVAPSYDAFITFDLHRQEAEWLAVNRALVESGAKILRIRLPRQSADPRLDVVRSLTYRMEQWMQELQSGKVLITIGQLGVRLSARTREEVMRMLEERGGGPAGGR
jgi:hypothetical protein